MSEHSGVTPAQVDPVICQSRHEAVNAFTRNESPDPLFRVCVEVGGEASEWFVFARGPVAARDAVLKCVDAERIPQATLWAWIKDELAALQRQAADSLEGGTGCVDAKEHCDAG